MSLALRQYQQEAVSAIFSKWDRGKRSTLLSMATGTGKTLVYAEVIRRYLASDGARPVLILAHRAELLEQGKEAVAESTGIECGLEKGADWCSMTDRVVLGSVQTLCGQKRLARFGRDHFGLIVVDEAHHTMADSYRRVLDWFQGALVLGVTATPYRGDGQELGIVFESLAYDYPVLRGIREGYLTPISAQVVPVKINLSEVQIVNGDYAAGQLGDALAPHIAEAARRIATICTNRKTVIFLPLVRTAEKICKSLQELGLDAREVDGESFDRQETLEWFDSAGPGSVLCNSMLLTEGWDCPSVDCIVGLRVTRSRGLYMQMIGRGTRPCPQTDKKDLLLLDFLWQAKDMLALCRPASLYFEDSAIAAQVMDVLEQSGECMSLDDARTAASDAAERRLEEELETLNHAAALMDNEQLVITTVSWSEQLVDVLTDLAEEYQKLEKTLRDAHAHEALICLVKEALEHLEIAEEFAELNAGFTPTYYGFYDDENTTVPHALYLDIDVNLIARSMSGAAEELEKASGLIKEAAELDKRSSMAAAAKHSAYTSGVMNNARDALVGRVEREQKAARYMEAERRRKQNEQKEYYQLYTRQGYLLGSYKLKDIQGLPGIEDLDIRHDDGVRKATIRTLERGYYIVLDENGDFKAIEMREDIRNTRPRGSYTFELPFCRLKPIEHASKKAWSKDKILACAGSYFRQQQVDLPAPLQRMSLQELAGRLLVNMSDSTSFAQAALDQEFAFDTQRLQRMAESRGWV